MFVQGPIARLVFFADLRDAFIHGGDRGLVFAPVSPRAARHASAAPKPGPRHFRLFFRQSNPPRADRGHLLLVIRRRRSLPLQFRELVQQIAVGGVVLLEPALDARPARDRTARPRPWLRLPLEDRLLFLLQLGQRRVLFLCVLLALQLDLSNPFFDRGNSERHFLLFLLEFLERDNLIAHLRKIYGLGATFPAKVDLAFLQDTLLVA